MSSTRAAAAGSHALTRLAAAVLQLKGHEPLTSITVLGPSNLAALTARRFLAASGGVAAVQVTTIERLAETLGAPLLAGQRPATRTVTAASWREALRAEPGTFDEVVEHPSTVAALARTYGELRELSELQLDLVAQQPDPGPDLVRLHREVESRLGGQWYDVVDLVWAASDNLDRFTDPVILYLPGRLSSSEQRFVDALRRDRPFVEIHLEEPSTHATRIIHASDADDEVRAVVRAVVDDLKEPKRVAVLYSDPRPYARLLSEQLATAGIRVNGPGARPVVERTTIRTYLSLLDLADQGLPRAPLFQALSGAPVLDFDGTWIPTARWERNSRAAGVACGDHWDDRLDTWIRSEARPFDKESGERLATFARRLRQEFAIEHASWESLTAWAATLFARLIAGEQRITRLPLEEQAACATLQLTLRGLAVLDPATTAPTVRALHDLLSMELGNVLPRVGRFGDGVYVGPISSAAGLDLDVVYTVGLSEDLCPGTQREDVLLPDRIREQLDGALPTLRERIEEQHQALLTAFSAAPVVVATFSRGDLRQTKGRLPSRWLLPTLRKLSGDDTLSATQWAELAALPEIQAAGSFAGELLQSNRLATEQEWRVRAAIAEALDDVILTSARELLDARSSSAFTRFDGNLTSATGLPDHRTGVKAISPSSLEKYAECPHAYFVNNVLGVQPIENPEDIVTIPATELGTFIHACMEDLTKQGNLPGPGAPWTPAHHDALRAIADAKAAAFEGRGVTGHERLWSVEKERITNTLTAMLDDDSTWRANTGAAIVEAELEFGMKDGGPGAIAVPVPGGTVLMRGSADKVDVADGRIYVTDIKSGRKGGYTAIKQGDPAPRGSKLQLPAYAYAALAALDRDLPVTALYWFVHKDSGRIELEFDDAVRDRYGRVLGTLAAGIAGGLFIATPPAKDDFAFVQCAFCNPDGIGYAARRREWQAKSSAPEMAELVALVVRNEVGDD